METLGIYSYTEGHLTKFWGYADRYFFKRINERINLISAVLASDSMNKEKVDTAKLTTQHYVNHILNIYMNILSTN